MKCLKRNQTQFYYALYISRLPIVDEYGNTGESEVIYGNPLPYCANISAAKGETATRQFGDAENYDKVIVMDNTAPAIDEYSVLWIDRIPQLAGNGALALNRAGEVITPHDYIVRKVARSLNSVSIAVSKVKING